MIKFSDFKKIELRVAKVLKAEAIEGSDKLVKLKIDLGDKKRQILAGIRKYYPLDKLTGRQIVVVVNLEPKKMMGEESQGMLLAADEEGEPVLLGPDREVGLGAKIK